MDAADILPNFRGCALHDFWEAYLNELSLSQPPRPIKEPKANAQSLPHLREYRLDAQILVDLGIQKIRLLVSQPKTVVGLEDYSLRIVEQVRLE